MIQNQFNASIKILHSDHGGEYTSHEFATYLSQNGIIHQYSCPHTPEQNGIAERKNRHVMETARTLLSHASLSNEFWLEAASTATYLINRLPTKTLNMSSPYQKLYHKLPSYTHLKTFGCLCYPWIAYTRNNKLDPKSSPCLFLGYSSDHKGFRCYDYINSKLIISRHVKFHESHFPMATPSSLTTTTNTNLHHDPIFFPISTTPNTRPPPPIHKRYTNPPITYTRHHPIHISSSKPPPISRPPPQIHQRYTNPPTTYIRHHPTTISSSKPPLLTYKRGPHKPFLTITEIPHSDHPTFPSTEQNFSPTEPVQKNLPLSFSSPEPKQHTSTPVLSSPEHSPPISPQHQPKHLMLTKTHPYKHKQKPLLTLSHTLTDPLTFKQAFPQPHWHQAMTNEINALHDQQTWILVPKPLHHPILGSKWTFKTKLHPDGSVSRYKARLVAQGYMQTYVIDYLDTFSPVAKIPTIRLFFIIAFQRH